MFKVGDRVKVVHPYDCHKYFSVGAGGIVTLVEDTIVQVKFDSGNYDADGGGGGEWWAAAKGLKLVHKVDDGVKIVDAPPAVKYTADNVVSISRSNDPATSKGKRRVNKYEQAVLNSLRFTKEGRTGKEIASDEEYPLNSITPRFAPLRRKGLIKPLKVEVGRGVGQVVKRDKQIVWVLA